MPFKSQAQAKFMFANHPKMAKEWAAKTKSIRALPMHVKKNIKGKKDRKHYESMLTRGMKGSRS